MNSKNIILLSEKDLNLVSGGDDRKYNTADYLCFGAFVVLFSKFAYDTYGSVKKFLN